MIMAAGWPMICRGQSKHAAICTRRFARELATWPSELSLPGTWPGRPVETLRAHLMKEPHWRLMNSPASQTGAPPLGFRPR